MKLIQLLEMPLPRSWDSEIFDEHNSFASRLKYAREKAKAIGTGSARVAFLINYKGKPSVLKIAKNKKGMVQNEVEASRSNDWFLEKMGIVIPIIDYDTKNTNPTWIHMRRAQKIKDSDFIRISGANIWDLVNFAAYEAGVSQVHVNMPVTFRRTQFFETLVDLIGNYTDMSWGDLKYVTNWGLYRRSPVIIDIGLNKDTFTKYYSR